MGVLFYLSSEGQHILVSDTIMAVFLLIIILSDVLIDSGQNVTQYNNHQIHIHDSVTNYNIFDI
jgi:hypothetical protein